MERKVVCHLIERVKPAFVFKDLPDTIPDPIISAESSHRHPVTTNMQTTKSGRRSFEMGNSGSIPKSLASVVTESTDILKLSHQIFGKLDIFKIIKAFNALHDA
ncbi:hypothetical protein TNCV_2056671 [Trichonephila clavipes]|nr:hypothetical protein TNCV_2056671 [Trichonephila clavipes]